MNKFYFLYLFIIHLISNVSPPTEKRRQYQLSAEHTGAIAVYADSRTAALTAGHVSPFNMRIPIHSVTAAFFAVASAIAEITGVFGEFFGIARAIAVFALP